MGEIILQESVLRKHYSPRCYMGDINIVHPKSTQINDALMLKTGWRMENDCLNQEFYNIMNHNGNNKSLKVVLEKKKPANRTSDTSHSRFAAYQEYQ